MKRISTLFLLIVALVCTTSCSEEQPKSSVDWGSVEYFESSIFKTYEPVILKKKLNFDFNEDAKKELAKDTFVFRLVETVDGKDVTPDVYLYINGERQEGSSFTLTVADCGVVELGVELKPEAEEGYHRFYLVYDDKASETTYPLNVTKTVLDDGLLVEKVDVMNPGNVIAFWVAVVIISLILTWYCFIRPKFFGHLAKSKAYIAYPGSSEHTTVVIRGCCNLILTNKPIKQNIFAKILCIPDAVEVNEVWTTKITISTGARKRLKIRGGVSYIPDEPVHGEEFTIITDEGVKVKITC